MGIDYSGGMLVGCEGLPCEPDDWDEDENGDWEEYLYEEHNIKRYSQHYDADTDECYFGIPIDDILVAEMDNEWLVSIKQLAEYFKDITGEDAYLIGTQNIW